jgi:hypothetical protein
VSKRYRLFVESFSLSTFQFIINVNYDNRQVNIFNKESVHLETEKIKATSVFDRDGNDLDIFLAYFLTYLMIGYLQAFYPQRPPCPSRFYTVHLTTS